MRLTLIAELWHNYEADTEKWTLTYKADTDSHNVNTDLSDWGPTGIPWAGWVRTASPLWPGQEPARPPPPHPLSPATRPSGAVWPCPVTCRPWPVVLPYAGWFSVAFHPLSHWPTWNETLELSSVFEPSLPKECQWDITPNKSEAKLTASSLKWDQDTQMVKKNTYFNQTLQNICSRYNPRKLLCS